MVSRIRKPSPREVGDLELSPVYRDFEFWSLGLTDPHKKVIPPKADIRDFA